MTEQKGIEFLEGINYGTVVEWITAETLLYRPEDPLMFIRDLVDEKICKRTNKRQYVPADTNEYLRSAYSIAAANVDDNGVLPQFSRRPNVSSSTASDETSIRENRLLENVYNLDLIMSILSKFTSFENLAQIAKYTVTSCKTLFSCEHSAIFLLHSSPQVNGNVFDSEDDEEDDSEFPTCPSTPHYHVYSTSIDNPTFIIPVDQCGFVNLNFEVSFPFLNIQSTISDPTCANISGQLVPGFDIRNPESEEMVQVVVKSVLSAPILINSSKLGVLVLANRTSPTPLGLTFDRNDERNLILLSSQIASCIDSTCIQLQLSNQLNKKSELICLLCQISDLCPIIFKLLYSNGYGVESKAQNESKPLSALSSSLLLRSSIRDLLVRLGGYFSAIYCKLTIIDWTDKTSICLVSTDPSSANSNNTCNGISPMDDSLTSSSSFHTSNGSQHMTNLPFRSSSSCRLSGIISLSYTTSHLLNEEESSQASILTNMMGKIFMGDCA